VEGEGGRDIKKMDRSNPPTQKKKIQGMAEIMEGEGTNSNIIFYVFKELPIIPKHHLSGA
jgi:hypothetical protein